eukprot:CAMPEP_0198208494 /NCGR_PEP_ID=MMETSP1445-20131203/11859_1 /TAXON_ID=36898 /ORGANISM="Pyramimonas sp., Strain CCMP2087" /LENGTH=56 /DNA_ID=CAMNT_0043881919 /DNA_START=20 /DNA_END=190 /DNA_ORIENTATION=+
MNAVTVQGVIGYLITVSGTGLYSWSKAYDPLPPRVKSSSLSDSSPVSEQESKLLNP